jgi:hypothetical protein
MKRYKANGELIKKLRQNRDRAATQKEFAHEVRISGRQLREAENRDAAMPRDILERIAKSLGKSWQAIIVGGAEHTPAGASFSNLPAAQQALAKEPLVIVPRFESTSASMTRDEVELVSQAKDNRVVVSHLMTRLATETEAYAEELLELLGSVTWTRRDCLAPMEARDELPLRRRVRELLVLLKGNDVWVYATTHLKFMPESDVMPPKRNWGEVHTQLIVAFGPPGEYGETSISVPIDNGHPWSYEPNTLPF